MSRSFSLSALCVMLFIGLSGEAVAAYPFNSIVGPENVSLDNTVPIAGRPDDQSSQLNHLQTLPPEAVSESLSQAQKTEIDLNHPYTLPELVELALKNNPSTRVAWERARQAALAENVVKASYWPVITASAVTGYEEIKTPLPEVSGYQSTLAAKRRGAALILSLKWLLFDFGQRSSLASAAKQTAMAASELVGGVQQKVIMEMTDAYYLYAASRERQKMVQQALKNARTIQAAVLARRAQGLATIIAVAQANQSVAQEELHLVQVDGQVKNTYQTLLAALGVQADLKIALPKMLLKPLPKVDELLIDEPIEQGLAQRPDIAASYATLKASRKGIDAVRAGYLPKVFVAGNIAKDFAGFNVDNLPVLQQQYAGTGVFLGITMPIFDGGLRHARLQEAQSRALTAQADFQRIKTADITEIVLARSSLKSALASQRAAASLVAASQVTFDAALDAYRHGVGTIDVATAAENALLVAREAQIDASTATRIQAVKLAFALGALMKNHNPAVIGQ